MRRISAVIGLAIVVGAWRGGAAQKSVDWPAYAGDTEQGRHALVGRK